jgi:rSAM/selenodomain-associated transferase 1
MDTSPVRTEIAIIAKAPLPGFCKTRLIPRLGAEGAAHLQARFVERAVDTALAAGLGAVTLWCAPTPSDPLFQRLTARGIRLATQPDGDLGERIGAAFLAAKGPLVLIGTDCPCLEPRDLEDAASALAKGADVALAPAEDGGYGLIATTGHHAALFRDMPWSTPEVAALTLERAAAAGLAVTVLRTIWDVDTPADLDRLSRWGWTV